MEKELTLDMLLDGDYSFTRLYYLGDTLYVKASKLSYGYEDKYKLYSFDNLSDEDKERVERKYNEDRLCFMYSCPNINYQLSNLENETFYGFDNLDTNFTLNKSNEGLKQSELEFVNDLIEYVFKDTKINLVKDKFIIGNETLYGEPYLTNEDESVKLKLNLSAWCESQVRHLIMMHNLSLLNKEKELKLEA